MVKQGPLREILLLQENVPAALVVTSLTRTSTTATAITAVPHLYTTNDYVLIAGATPAGYNFTKIKVTVTGPTSFTYPVLGTLASPATGSITATYFSGPGGEHVIGWESFRTIHAELIPVKAWESLQVQALQGQLDYRFRIHTVDSGGITNEMRALWTPQWPVGAPVHTLEIGGILPEGDGRQWHVLDMSEVV